MTNGSLLVIVKFLTGKKAGMSLATVDIAEVFSAFTVLRSTEMKAVQQYLCWFSIPGKIIWILKEDDDSFAGAIHTFTGHSSPSNSSKNHSH